jgi:hypothetical protein
MVSGMARLNLRVLVLVPLLAAGVDFARATAACGSRAQTCLEAAGRGWLGPWAVLLVVASLVGVGLMLARGAQRTAVPSFGRRWAVGTAGLIVACAVQDAVARLSGGGALGGGQLVVVALCAAGGVLIAFLLRAVDTAVRLVARAPRLPYSRRAGLRSPRLLWIPVAAPRRGPGRGRAPPRD